MEDELYFWKKLLPQIHLKRAMSLDIFLFFNELSPVRLTSMFGVVDIIELISRRPVPLLPKSKRMFFLHNMIRAPYQRFYIYFFPSFIILQFNFFRHSIVEKTSSLKRTFDILEIPWLIEPIKSSNRN